MTLLLLFSGRGASWQTAIGQFFRALRREHRVSGPGDRAVTADVRETRVKRLS
jgi:hypothetical protein